MNHPLVAIVILNYNGKKFLQQFLPSVIENSNESWAKIIVADNASSDGSVDFMRSTFPEVQLIELTENYGYAGGYNMALKQIEAEFFVLLNSDIEVTKNWLNAAVSLLQSDEKIAAAQPKILDFYKRDFFEYAGAAGGYIDVLGYPFSAGRVFDYIEKDEGQYDQPLPIFWASGACLFVRAKAFWQAGGFDADFFAHQEEIDLCWRLQRMSYEIWSCPQSEVFHVGGGTLSYANPRKTFLNFRNNLLMLCKNLSLLWLLIVIPQRLVLDGVAALQSVIKHQSLKDLWAIMKAHFAFYASVPSIIQKRIEFKQPYSLPVSMYKQSVLWKYFFERKKTAREIFKL
jgi:GT2 family glycosyltransferase